MKNLHRLILAHAIVCVSPCAIAEDLSFLPRLTIGYMNYSLEIPSLFPGVVPTSKFEANTAVIGAGATLSWNRLYLDAYGQTSGKMSDSLSVPILNYNEEYDGYLTDFLLAAGVNITDNFSIYMGYKYDKLDLSGNIGFNSNFQEDGYFLGASYGWVIQGSGVLALNLAVADLDGNLRFQTPALNADFDGTCNARGLSYGISWKSAIIDNWGYSVALNGYQYKFKDIVDKRFDITIPGEILEDMFTVRVSISYLFD